ncbi:MFS transporter [Brevibacterium sp. VCM10]|uniref:MFS transporter n=1 Tax=Brevibacterium sp. VCM10 TaxID=1381751 RepID=UPI00047195F0|nr:MFS transporter [Brevibacterium sp. VCM10]
MSTEKARVGSAADSPTASMTLGQYAIVGLCMFLNMTDGFDLFLIGFALPHLPQGFATESEKGFIISLALVGMAIGAIFLARLADRIGRRATVLCGLLTNIVGLAVSALAVNEYMLMTGRFITGMGVGVVSVVIVVIAQEATPADRQNTATGIVMIGFPLGSTIAGFGGAAALALTGNVWQSLFWLGAALSLIGLVVAYFWLPESAAFKARIAGGAAPGTAEAASVDTPVEPAERLGLLSRPLWAITVLLALGYGMLSAAYYFVGTWTPQLVTDLTNDQSAGATAGIVVSVGTFAGTILFALIGLKVSSVRLTTVLLVLGVASVIGFSVLLPSAGANVFAGLLGLAVFGSMSGYTAMVPKLYPVLARARGYGMMLGVGRAGAIISPVLVGFAATRVDTGVIYLLAIIPVGFALLASVTLLVRSARVRRESSVV